MMPGNERALRNTCDGGSGKQGNANTHRAALICYPAQRTWRDTLDRLAWEDSRLTFKWDKRY